MIPLRSAIAVCILCASINSAFTQEPVVLKHEGWVATLVFSPNGKTLASAGSDKVVRLWEVGTWKSKQVLKGHRDYVSALSYNHNGFLASGGVSGELWGWNLKTETAKNVRKDGPPINSLYVIVEPIAAMISAGLDGLVRIEPSLDGKPYLYRHRSWVNGFAAHQKAFASASSDGTVGLVIGELTAKPIFLEGGAGEVRCVAFSPDGKQLAAGNRYGTVRIWDVASRKEVKTITGHMGEVWSIAFSPDGKTLAAVDTEWKKPSKVKLYDTTTWKERGALPCPGEILCIAYSPNGDWLAAGSWDKTVRVFALKR